MSREGGISLEALYYKLITEKKVARQIKIIDILVSDHRVISVTDLAKLVETSTKTLAEDVVGLNLQLPEGSNIELKKGVGYTLDADPNGQIYNWVKEILNASPLFVILTGIYNYKILTPVEWADSLYLSETTLRKHLSKLNDILYGYNLKLNLKNVELEGREEDIRFFFFTYFYGSRYVPHMEEPSFEIIELFKRIKNRAKKLGIIKLTIQYNRSLYWLMIIKRRNQFNKYMQIAPSLKKRYENTYLYSLIKDIFSEENELTGDMISDELIYICILFADVSLHSEQSDSTNPFKIDYLIDFKVLEEIEALTSKVLSSFNIPIGERKVAFSAIETYLTDVLILNELSPRYIKNAYDINRYAKINYPEFFSTWECMVKKSSLVRWFNAESLEDIAANLTILTQSFYRYDKIFLKKVLFILEGSKVQLTYLNTLINQIKSESLSVNIVSNQEIILEALLMFGADIVISNYDISNIITKNVIQISEFPTKKEWSLVINTMYDYSTTSAKDVLDTLI